MERFVLKPQMVLIKIEVAWQKIQVNRKLLKESETLGGKKEKN